MRINPIDQLVERALSSAAHKSKLIMIVAASCLVSGAVHAETLGYVVTNWNFAGQYTEGGKLECPSGFNPDNRDNFRATFKTEEEREEALKKYANFEMRFRGPNGESDLYNPDLVHDPLPFTDAKGTISTGVNLDGTPDGGATDKTCKHTKFSSPDGRPGIDNQMYRVTGCNRGTRPDGLFDVFFNNEIITKQTNRWLVEVSGVDSRENDNHVDVVVAHGLDKLVQDASGGFVPGLSQRVDHAMPRYIARSTGRIENGVLITDPFTQVILPTTSFLEEGEHHLKNMVLRLDLKPTGASGSMSAYHDVDRYYRFWAKTTGLHGVSNIVSPPSFWAALKRNADGFKDPATGVCTAISAVYDLKLVSAFIVHKPQSVASVENSGLKTANER